ncbi:MAG: cysteine--tRNA ligase [Cellvibrionales bacterium TMED49]|nr:cysteine--tRNA ligase [Porticoccaceae bacterium]OUU39841.1 MAG: cysteine--tRNA ligase [Cellvibrionales bacterium TMED49]
MPLVIYNTLTRRKEDFSPICSTRVTMYVCGPTVYNRVHIGNARPAVIFDVLFRVLQTLYPRVDYARNITDIDDKIIKASRELNQDISVITERYSRLYIQDMDSLNNLTPTFSPRATDHISEMLDIITDLVKSGFAYFSDGHVLFSVAADSNYGKLSQRLSSELMAGARIDVASYKQNPGDFVLWKPSGPADPGWPSRWGRGRPGWHIECSAMVKKHLGETIDIHGGGQDLLFPHHENENAQSRCIHNGRPLSNFWMHNGFVNLDGEKMSKSLGNFRLVGDLLKKYPGEVLRYAILTAHYRFEQNFGFSVLDAAKNSLNSLYGYLRAAENIKISHSDEVSSCRGVDALLDDLNTPLALSELHRIAKEMHTSRGTKQKRLKTQLMSLSRLMGLLQQKPEAWFKNKIENQVITNDQIEDAINARKEAKFAGDYVTADIIRKRLEKSGVVLEDSRKDTTWRRR